MKTQVTAEQTKAILLTFLAGLLLISTMMAQTIPLQESFSSLNADGSIIVTLKESQANSIEIMNGENHPAEEILKYSIKNNELSVQPTGKVNELQIVVHYTDLKNIKASGVASVKSDGIINKPSLSITSDGASDVDVSVNTEQLTLNPSAASTLKLNGTATSVTAKASGAADIKATNLTVENASIDASGAADVKMNVTKSATVNGSGAADVRLVEKPETVTSNMTGVSTLKYGDITIDSDFSEMMNDSTWSDNADKKSRKKFDGHWGGIEIGMNTFIDNQFNTTLPAGYDFLELNTPKSITVQINLIEQNVPIIKNQFGLVTGLGLWVNNYRFANNVVLGTDSLGLFGFADTSQNYIKSKLTASYLVLPLIFEYQVRNKNGKEIFHVAAGGYGAVKLGSKTKMVYLHDNTKIKNKEHDDFDMNPFKYGLTARIGWRKLNFFGNYNLSTLWQKNKGPVVYPFEVGITLVGW
jgi:hypothetical protein